MFRQHALAFADARLKSSIPSYRYNSSCLNGNGGKFCGKRAFVANIESQNGSSFCSYSAYKPRSCKPHSYKTYCYAPVWAGALLAVCLSFAPVNKGIAQETKTLEEQSSQLDGVETTQPTSPLTASPTSPPTLQEKVDRLEGQVKRLSEDFKDLATIAKDDDASRATNASWIAVMAKLQERLRVIEHTLTDLTARTEQLERFGMGRADSSHSLPGGEDGGGDAQGLFDKAQKLLRERKVEQAIETFKQFVENHPSDERIAEVMFYLGESYTVMQDHKQAADAFLNGYKRNRKGVLAPKLLLRLGQTLAKLKKDKQACRVLKEFKKYFTNKDEQLDAIVESEIAANACSAG